MTPESHSDRTNDTELRVDLPPKSIIAAIHLVTDHEPDLRRIGHALSQDPVLTALLLASVNSGYYCLAAPVTTVERAIAFLGMENLRSLMVCVLLRRLVRQCGENAYPINHFWQSSLCRGVASRHLATAMGRKGPEDSFTIGLCQDLGVLLRIITSPTKTPTRPAQLGALAPRRIALERSEGRPTHPEVASQWLRAWSCPADIAIPVAFHHSPHKAPSQYRTAAWIAWASEAIADLWFANDTPMAVRTARAAIEKLRFNPDQLEQIVDVVQADLIQSTLLFDIPQAANFDNNPIQTEAKDSRAVAVAKSR